MELFRNHPNLCSLFLRSLEEWGATTLDWSLLGNETFVDRFLRQLVTTDIGDEAAVTQACAALVQPSPGGLLAAGTLARHGYFDGDDLHEFIIFTLQGSANRWERMSWTEVCMILEELIFVEVTEEPAWHLACLMARGWLPRELQTRFFRRVWQTCHISLEQKKLFFRWLYGQHSWNDLPKAPSSYPDEKFSLKVAYRLSSRKPYSRRGRGISASLRERRLIG